jgi:uncharacterized protein with von Willebrand factor type A (vWA) domain
MKKQNREVSIFSTSALDLFASALGAFILLVMILFPYYQRAGSSEQSVDFERLMGERRRADSQLGRQQLEVKSLGDELATLEGQYRASRQRVQDLESSIPEPAVAVVDTSQEEKTGIAKKPRAIADGVEFSILGLSTEAKRFLILVDMSGSMEQYRDIMVKAVREILAPLEPDNEFAIVGYQHLNGVRLHRFPRSQKLASGNPRNIEQARRFANGLIHRFGGGTPTQFALLNALQYDVDAIILMSDGEPTDGQWKSIIRDVTRVNGRRKIELHTVAIGNYFDKKQGKQLTMFLHQLAKRNGGDFVGISR